MDDVARYNVDRWRKLADADALFTRPALNLDPVSARRIVDPDGRLGNLSDARVLCLASGGGKQSAAFALLGARVTVLDLSDAQLVRDRLAAQCYGIEIETVEGDMRDLYPFKSSSFDIVYQPYSLNFVPDQQQVFGEVSRVLRLGGLYHLVTANPFLLGVNAADWDGTGYPLRHPYVQGAQVTTRDAEWVYDRSQAANGDIPESREYRHTLAATLNALLAQGFRLLGVADDWHIYPDHDAQPGTWDHFQSVAPAWLAYWFQLER